MQRGVRQCDLRQLFVGVLRGRRRPVYEMFEHEGGRSTNQNGKQWSAFWWGNVVFRGGGGSCYMYVLTRLCVFCSFLFPLSCPSLVISCVLGVAVLWWFNGDDDDAVELVHFLLFARWHCGGEKMATTYR